MTEHADGCSFEDSAQDQELISRLRAGDMQAGRILYRRYKNPLWNFIYKQMGSYQNSCDILQETWLRFFSFLSDKDLIIKGASLKPFLCKIALNFIRDRHRRSVVHQRVTENLFKRNLSPDQENPVELAINTENEENIRLSLSKLPYNQYQAIKLRFYDNLSFREISSVLGVPLSTAYNLLAQAIKNMRIMLSKGDDDGAEFKTRAQ